ncbi:helix-turn-helix domain-containing protein [Fodinibius sp. Rm-B-1B1-1]|uniref:helix-turn-helix domain-containing protein n=1 Tax=Fodinibius alkaliphilus TaxID=3140241 RepID=UPI00315AA922
MGNKYIIPYKRFIGCLIPNFLMRRKEMSQGAKLCYGRLAQYAGRDGKAYPKQKQLSKELGVSSRMIRKYLNELIGANLIEVQQKGKKQPNSYRFLRHSWMDQDKKYAKSERNNGSTHPGTKVPPTQDYSSTPDRNNSSGPYKENHNEENQRRESTNSIAREDCEKIFSVYPRKVKKVKALKEIEKAIKRLEGTEVDKRVISEPVDWLLERVKTFASSPAGKGDRFTPHPDNFFRDERYLDDQREWFKNGKDGNSKSRTDEYFEQGEGLFETIDKDTEAVFEGRRQAENITENKYEDDILES